MTVDPIFGVPLPLLAMAIGDPDSGLDEMGRNLAASSILKQLQADTAAAEAWELMRFQDNLPDERTLQDLSVSDVRRMCSEFYDNVQNGLMPDPASMIIVDGDSTGVDLDEQEQELFNSIAESTSERLRQVHYVHPSTDGSGLDEADADLYVLLVGLLTNSAEQLRNGGFEDDAQLLDAASIVALRLFSTHVRMTRKLS